MRRDRELKNASNPNNRQTNYLIMSLKQTLGRIIRSKVQNLTRFFNNLPASNSNFRPARINSEKFPGAWYTVSHMQQYTCHFLRVIVVVMSRSCLPMCHGVK